MIALFFDKYGFGRLGGWLKAVYYSICLGCGTPVLVEHGQILEWTIGRRQLVDGIASCFTGSTADAEGYIMQHCKTIRVPCKMNIGGSFSLSSHQRAGPGSAHPSQKSSSRQRHVVTSTHNWNIMTECNFVGFFSDENQPNLFRWGLLPY
jgi:hypothetical protein